MATTISNLTNSTSLDGLLKNVYLPTMQSVAYDDTRFSEMIQVRTIPGGGNQIVHFAETQRAEGVGTISEGGNWVSNVPVKGQQVTENVKYLNQYIALTGPVIKAANSNEKSAVDIVSRSFKSNIRAFKNNFDRMLMGDGSGRMALISVISSPAITVTKTSFALAPFNADQFIPVGARCNIATFGTGATEAIAATGMKNANASDDYGFIVAGHTSRSSSAGTAVIDLHDEDDSAYAAAGTTDVAVGDYFIREGAYGTAAATAKNWTDCQEINGLMNLVSDGTSNSETSGNYVTTWGKTRTSYNFLQSYMKDFSAELDEDNLLDMMMDLQYGRQATPNLLMTTPKATKKYFLNKKDDRRFTNVGPMNFVGGYTRMGIQLGDWQLILTDLAACPSGKLFIISTSDFAFCQNSPLDWVLGDGGQVLVQSHTGDNKFATAVQYVNFVCFDQYRQGKGYSVTE